MLRQLHHSTVGNLLGVAAGISLPSVILASIYAQTRVFFAMSRDGLLPPGLSKVHPRFHTPHVMTIITGPVRGAGGGVPAGGASSPISAIPARSMRSSSWRSRVMLLRVRQPGRARPFRTPILWLVGPLTIGGCTALFFFLPIQAKLLLPIWSAIGLAFYFFLWLPPQPSGARPQDCNR